MQLKIDKKRVTIPFALDKITISDFLRFQKKHGAVLDAEITELLTAKEEADEKELAAEQLTEKKAIAWASFWAKLDLAGSMPADAAVLLTDEFSEMIGKMNAYDAVQDAPARILMFKEETWLLPDHNIDPSSPMTFNEIITSKEVIRQLRALEKTKWDTLPYLAAIFLRKPAESFQDAFIHEGSERLKLMHELPMDKSLQVGLFYEQLCKYLSENFSVFASGGSGDSKPEFIAHYEQWGWISFLSSVAEAKIFDIPGSGLDSIECAKLAKAYKVLTYASEKKDMDRAMKDAYKL